MMNVPLFFASSITVTSLVCFSIGSQGMYVNRTFHNIPLTLLDVNVLKENVNPETPSVFIYYFDKINVEKDIKNYLSSNLKNHVDSYQIKVKFYKYENNAFETCLEDEKSNALKVRFKCVYYQNFKVDSSLSFYIEEGIKQYD